MAFAGNAWFAATTGGVVISHDRGATWKSAAKDELVKQQSQSLEVSSDGSQVWAVSQRNLLYSADGGAHWDARELPFASAGNLPKDCCPTSRMHLARQTAVSAFRRSFLPLLPRRRRKSRSSSPNQDQTKLGRSGARRNAFFLR
jgi:hypothetical protein